MTGIIEGDLSLRKGTVTDGKSDFREDGQDGQEMMAQVCTGPGRNPLFIEGEGGR